MWKVLLLVKFKIFEKNSKPIIQISIDKEENFFTPEEILAMILAKMCEISVSWISILVSLLLGYIDFQQEGYLGKTITHALVTVPSDFNDAQRRATIDAIILTGLHIIRLCNESTPAALSAFQLDQKER